MARGVMAAFAAACLLVAPASGHETDQFTMPLNTPMADLGDWLDTVHYRAVDRAVRKLNEEVEAALKIEDPAHREAVLAWVRRPENAVAKVHQSFSDAFTEIMDVEFALRGEWAKRAYPDMLTVHQPDRWIYSRTHFWIDPRQIVLSFRSSTIKAYGVYFGTDKLSHFHHMGTIYYDEYRKRREAGMSDDEATAYVVRAYANGNVIGENALLGFIATGVYSNADLAANFAGLKFNINVTEPVFIKGRLREPMIVRKGEFFRVNKHVRPESGWFGAFISDHWNEALNPSWYNWEIRSSVRSALASRSKVIEEFYTKVDGRPADPRYYTDLAVELSLMDGQDYGHCRKWDKLMTIAHVCWPDQAVTPGVSDVGETKQNGAALQGS
jgi:hypothetical protein